MQGANTETESKAKELELIKYSSPTDVEYLSVVLEPNMTANISKYNNCKALKVITNKESNENVINFVTFNRNKEQIDNEVIRSEIGKLLGIKMPNVSRISTTDKTKEGLMVDTNLKVGCEPTILSQLFSEKKAMYMKMDKASAMAMNDYKAYFPTEEDLQNPQTTFAMLLKGVSSLPYNQVNDLVEKQKFIEEYYDMIILDLLMGQKTRNGSDYYYYTKQENTTIKAHIIPGLLNYSLDMESKEQEYFLNDFSVHVDILLDKLFNNNYMFIKRVIDSLIPSLVEYKDCISRVIYNNTSIENARKLEEMIFHNIDRIVAKAHSIKSVKEHLSKIEKISSTTRIHLESVNRIIEFQQRYPTSKQEILENNDKITRLKQNENGDYEATLDEGVKVTLNQDEELAPTGYTSSGMLSALIAFVCGLGFGLAYIISHLD